MNQRYFSLFLCFVSLGASPSRATTTIEYKTVSSFDKISSDASVWFEDPKEQSRIEAFFAQQKNHPDIYPLRSTFFRDFLKNIRLWKLECIQNSKLETTKTLNVGTIQPIKEVLYSIHFIFKKQTNSPTITIHVTIFEKSPHPTKYLLNLLRGCVNEKEPLPSATQCIATFLIAGILVGSIICARKLTPRHAQKETSGQQNNPFLQGM